MLDADEAARRRELHQRVYAPGGSLSDAELAELHDLDNRNLITPAPVALEPAEPPVRGAQHAAWDPEDAASRDPRADEDSASAYPAADPVLDPTLDPTADSTLDPTLVRGAQHAASGPEVTASRDLRTEDAGTPWRRWLLPAIAVVAILAGLAFGRFVLGSGSDSIPMDAAQQKTWAQLEASDTYVPGSVALLGSRFGADAWTAHRKETDVGCVILTRGEEQSESCGLLEPEQGDSRLQAVLDYTDDGVDYILFAGITRDIDGNSIAVMRRHANEDWDWRSSYSDAELATLRTLEEAGFDGASLSIIGYDRDVPVWVYQGDRYCLMVVRDDVLAQQCGESGADSSQTLTLDGGDAAYTLQSSEGRGPVLTITRMPDLTTEG